MSLVMNVRNKMFASDGDRGETEGGFLCCHTLIHLWVIESHQGWGDEGLQREFRQPDSSKKIWRYWVFGIDRKTPHRFSQMHYLNIQAHKKTPLRVHLQRRKEAWVLFSQAAGFFFFLFFFCDSKWSPFFFFFWIYLKRSGWQGRKNITSPPSNEGEAGTNSAFWNFSALKRGDNEH